MNITKNTFYVVKTPTRTSELSDIVWHVNYLEFARIAIGSSLMGKHPDNENWKIYNSEIAAKKDALNRLKKLK